MTSLSWLIDKKYIINELFSTQNNFLTASPIELVNPLLERYDPVDADN